MKSVISLAAVVFLLAGCGGIVGCDEDSDDSASDGQVRSMTWETTGGGDLLFSIVPDENVFIIQVKRHDFQDVDRRLTLTSENGSVYSLVASIFSGERDLHGDTFEPKGMTGTWTTITLQIAGQGRVEIKNIRSGGELRQIRDFVTSRL